MARLTGHSVSPVRNGTNCPRVVSPVQQTFGELLSTSYLRRFLIARFQEGTSDYNDYHDH
jgi:hypothetical protein